MACSRSPASAPLFFAATLRFLARFDVFQYSKLHRFHLGSLAKLPLLLCLLFAVLSHFHPTSPYPSPRRLFFAFLAASRVSTATKCPPLFEFHVPFVKGRESMTRQNVKRFSNHAHLYSCVRACVCVCVCVCFVGYVLSSE